MPWKNNPLASEMEKISFRFETPAGYPPMVRSGIYVDGTQRVSVADPFVVNGTAYVGFSFVPEDIIGVSPVEGGVDVGLSLALGLNVPSGVLASST